MIGKTKRYCQQCTDDKRGGERELIKTDIPQALQMLFPTSSLLQRGVVLVAQFAQLRAPTAPLIFDLPPDTPGLSTSALGDDDSATGDCG
jgi:hypothetical protein